jgi:NAD(P)-dependent dehydrogenase (short-subunit alcohol dehydrogenase family)
MNHPVALITGATSGIGRVTALELSQRGWHVVLAVRNSDVRDALLLELLQEVSDPARVTVINLDLSDLASVQQ